MPRHSAAVLLAVIHSTSAANYVDGQCAAGATGDLFTDKCEFGAQFASTVSADYSLLWEVEYFDNYKVVKNGKSGAVHALHQCGVDAPTDLPSYAADATMVEVPVTSVATTSSTYLPFIEMLGERRALKAYTSSFGYVSSPCLRKMHRDGLIEGQAGSWPDTTNPDLEALGVQATFADAWGMSNHNAVELTDTSEAMPHAVLKTAEYVEYVGLYFNREKEASTAIAHIVENWLCTKQAVAAVVAREEPVPVLWSQYYSAATCADGTVGSNCADGSMCAGGWSVASGATWYAEIIEAAGGSLILPDVVASCTSWGAPYLSTAQLLEVGALAQVVVSPGPWTDAVDVSALPAYQNGRVFDNQGPNGANDWFERRVVEPDALLQDLAVAFHADAPEMEGLSRKWLRDVVANKPVGGVSDEDLDTACPDIDAPYEFSSTDMCARFQGSSSSKNSPNAAAGGYIALAVIASAIVLLSFGGLAYWTNRRLPPPSKAPPADGQPAVTKAAETA
jgi:ABC-type Fe3+-hydroxamate transport system substrate-binding protein